MNSSSAGGKQLQGELRGNASRYGPCKSEEREMLWCCRKGRIGSLSSVTKLWESVTTVYSSSGCVPKPLRLLSEFYLTLRCCAGHKGSDPHLLETEETPLTHMAPVSGNGARITHFST